MKITFLDLGSDKKVYKEYNGGYGTSFNAGNSLLGKILTLTRTSREEFPLLSYAYAATIFHQNNHEVTIEKNTIPTADLVIMHASMPNHRLEKDYLKKLKESNLKIGLIGPFPSTKPELFKEADFIIQGEPEKVIFQIAKTGKIPSGLINSPPIENLDSLPYPNWSLFPINKFSYSPIIDKKPFTFVLSSRGCSYGCDYCPYISKAHGHFRTRSIENIMGELIYLKEKFNIKGIQFRDPTFTLDKKRIEEICKAIIKVNLDLEMGCETRSDRLDKPLLDLMYQAGFRAIKIGIESAMPEILKQSKRIPIEFRHQEKIIKYCDKLGIKVIGFYVIGLENDTHESIKSTLAYSKKLNTAFANFTICTPIPGTEFYDRIKDKIFTNNYDLYDNFHPVFNHKNISNKDLIQYQKKALTSYYLRPKYIYSHLKRRILQ